MSILTKNQKLNFSKELGDRRTINVQIRWDDECGNGKNSFSITGHIIDLKIRGRDKWECAGCIHDEIKKHFPEFRHLIQWHLFDSNGPMHYVSNSMYHASDRDCHGLLKGESRQLKNGKTGLPAWHLVAIDEHGKEVENIYSIVGGSIDSEEKPKFKYTIEYRPYCRIGEGKTPDLDAARSSANWSEATLEDFTEEKLKARLPSLMEKFKHDIETLGFIY